MINESIQWQLKGHSPKIYDEYIVPAVSAPWYELLIETGLPYMQGPIADIGCGTGSFLLNLSEIKQVSPEVKLVGVDLNAAMLAVANQKNSLFKNKPSWIKSNFVRFPSIKHFVWHRIFGSPLIDALPQQNTKILINKITLELENLLKNIKVKRAYLFQSKQTFL